MSRTKSTLQPKNSRLRLRSINDSILARPPNWCRIRFHFKREVERFIRRVNSQTEEQFGMAHVCGAIARGCGFTPGRKCPLWTGFSTHLAGRARSQMRQKVGHGSYHEQELIWVNRVYPEPSVTPVLMSAIGGKRITAELAKCPLMTHSGSHA
jgi:hypothetical protein